MKHIVCIAIIILGNVFSIAAQNKEAVELTITISGMDSDRGTVFVAVYNSKQNFLKKEYRGDIAKINNKKAIITFKNLEEGTYAVSLFHDENDNKKMDTNFFGIPKEPYGISNGATGFMGSPKYEDAKFLLTENTTISIVMN